MDPLLKELLHLASEKFDVPEKLLVEIALEERRRRYQRGGERRFLDDRLREILEGETGR